MAELDPAATSKVQISNSGNGPRYVHTVDGPVIVAAGTTSAELEVRDAELAALPEGLKVGALEEGGGDDANAPGFRAADTGGAAEGVGVTIPEDLRSEGSADGMIKREELVAIAKAEDVKIESDDNKAQIVAKIAAARGPTE